MKTITKKVSKVSRKSSTASRKDMKDAVKVAKEIVGAVKTALEGPGGYPVKKSDTKKVQPVADKKWTPDTKKWMAKAKDSKESKAPKESKKSKLDVLKELVTVKSGRASMMIPVSEAVGCHFSCPEESAPKEGDLISLAIKDENVDVVAKLVRPLKSIPGGMLVMAFVEKGKGSHVILGKAKGEAATASWSVK